MTITAAKAYEIASSWGSYNTAGDPGACFYSFPVDDGRPVDEDHRKACIAYGEDCLVIAQGYVDKGVENVPGGDTTQDRDDLQDLIAFFRGATLQGQAMTGELEAIREEAETIMAGASDFARHAIRCLCFLGAEAKPDADGEPASDKLYDFDPTMIEPSDLRDLIADADAFLVKAKPLIDKAIATGEVKLSDDGDAYAHAAHDYELTRNGHGAGFWDGDWPEAEGEALTKLAKAEGELDLYEGDDGIIRVQ